MGGFYSKSGSNRDIFETGLNACVNISRSHPGLFNGEKPPLLGQTDEMNGGKSNTSAPC